MDCIHTHQGILGQGWRVLAKSGQSKAVFFVWGCQYITSHLGEGGVNQKMTKSDGEGGFSKPKVVSFMDSP